MIVEGEDDGSIYTVTELEQLLGHEYSKGELQSIHADMTFESTKNPSATYTMQILEAELKRACEMQVSDINFAGKKMDEIPPVLGQITRLTRLVLSDCKIKTLPTERLSALASLKTVDLKANALSHFPVCFSLPSVHTLLLDHNQIESMSADDISPMIQLRVLTMFANKLKSFPREITDLPHLTKLDLECNFIKRLEFDSSSFGVAFELSLDPNVNTPSGKSPKPNKQAAMSAVAAFLAASSSNGTKVGKKTPLAIAGASHSPPTKKLLPTSPTKRSAPAAARKRKSMSDADVGSPTKAMDVDHEADISQTHEEPARKKRRLK